MGHEIDQAIADLTAHTAFKTPTKVAEFLVERVATADRSLDELARGLSHQGLRSLRRGREMLGRSERGLLLARHRVAASGAALAHLEQRLPRAARVCIEAHRQRLESLPPRLASAAPLTVERRRQRPAWLVDRLAARSQLRLAELAEKLKGWERLCVELSPERTLERGFSITRNAAGRALVAPDQAMAGEYLVTQLAGGRLTSRVEES